MAANSDRAIVKRAEFAVQNRRQGALQSTSRSFRSHGGVLDPRCAPAGGLTFSGLPHGYASE